MGRVLKVITAIVLLIGVCVFCDMLNYYLLRFDWKDSIRAYTVATATTGVLFGVWKLDERIENKIDNFFKEDR